MDKRYNFEKAFQIALDKGNLQGAVGLLNRYYKQSNDIATFLESTYRIYDHQNDLDNRKKALTQILGVLVENNKPEESKKIKLHLSETKRLLKVVEAAAYEKWTTEEESLQLKDILSNQVIKYGLVAQFKQHDFPFSINLSLTNRCNLNCIMCQHEDRLKVPKGDMDYEFALRMIDEIAQHGVRQISLQNFGESFLHPQITEIIQYAVQKGLYIRLVTNGTLVRNEMTQKIIDSGLQHIAFSVEGFTKERYEKIRPQASFDKVLANIKNLHKLKTEQKSPLKIELHTEIYQEDAEFRRLYTEFWKPFSDQISFSSLTLIEGISYVDKDGELISPTGDPEFAWKPCQYPFRFMVVKWNGEVAPCCVVTGDEIVLGDAKKDSLHKIWNSEKYQSFREICRKADYSSLPFCAQCPTFAS